MKYKFDKLTESEVQVIIGAMDYFLDENIKARELQSIIKFRLFKDKLIKQAVKQGLKL